MLEKVDVAIIGAGPAGTASALALKASGLSVLLVERDTFPRDKICGDALSADVVNQLSLLPINLRESFDTLEPKAGTAGIRFFAPNGKNLDLNFQKSNATSEPGYIARRLEFDHFLFEQVKKHTDTRIVEGFQVQTVEPVEGGVRFSNGEKTFEARMLIAADGAHSVAAKTLVGRNFHPEHHSAGIRRYYENVTGMAEGNLIELHFYKELLPGYLWIFPLPDNKANIGVGMLTAAVSKHKVNLKKAMDDLLVNHPNLKERFAEAVPLEAHRGFGLPLGSRKLAVSGDHFLLLGDAASLIDPFTGEGIGNAIRSGRVAADHVQEAFKVNNFSAAFNKAYDKELYRRIWPELKVSRGLQKMLRYPWLFNFFVRKAARNPSLQTLIVSMLDNVDLKRELMRPGFYVRLFFSR